MILGQRPSRSPRKRSFAVCGVGALAATTFFLLWLIFNVGGSRVTDGFDDIGELVAALCAAVLCGVAANSSKDSRRSWWLLGGACLAWAAGEAAWTYYDLIGGTRVPFPSLADVGFLTAIPLIFAGLLVFPGFPVRAVHRARGLLDGCIIATSILFASWALILRPVYREHHGSFLAQSISLAYPVSDIVMLSLVVILLGRSRQRRHLSLILVMVGVVALAVSDSSFAYFTEVKNYGSPVLDTGWVAAFFLIGLGALRDVTRPIPDLIEVSDESTVSLVAPYVPVLVVLAVTSIQLLRGIRLDPVSWTTAFALGLMVLGRELSRLWIHPSAPRTDANELALPLSSDSDSVTAKQCSESDS